MIVSKAIIVRWEWYGLHRWPDAPEGYAYLSYPHRHKFFATATIEVESNNREVEFHHVLDFIRDVAMPHLEVEVSKAPGECLEWSCEDFADFFLEHLKSHYGQGRAYKVEIFEDNENGGMVQWAPMMPQG